MQLEMNNYLVTNQIICLSNQVTVFFFQGKNQEDFFKSFEQRLEYSF